MSPWIFVEQRNVTLQIGKFLISGTERVPHLSLLVDLLVPQLATSYDLHQEENSSFKVLAYVL